MLRCEILELVVSKFALSWTDIINGKYHMIMRWAGHVARMGEGSGVYRGNLRERGHWGDRGVDGGIILRWIFRKLDVRVWTGLSWFRIGTDGGHLPMR
jgi:hypothetical protein